MQIERHVNLDKISHCFYFMKYLTLFFERQVEVDMFMIEYAAIKLQSVMLPYINQQLQAVLKCRIK